MLDRGVRLARRGAWVARLGIVRLSLDLLRAGSRRIPKLAAKISSGSGSQLTERLVGEVRKLPKELWPVVQSHWCQPKAFLSMADHLESLPASAAACRSACDLGDLPVTVLSGANSAANRLAEHQAMANRSTRGKLVIAQNSGHWIQLDEPDLVVAAVREIIQALR
jgi:pimeloyl-ACP methyl ester carboxylesterase